MKYANVKAVYYSDDDGRMIRAKINTMDNGVISKGQRATFDL